MEATSPLVLLKGMVISGGEVGVDIVTDLINQILVEKLTPAGWELCIFVECYTGML